LSSILTFVISFSLLPLPFPSPHGVYLCATLLRPHPLLIRCRLLVRAVLHSYSTSSFGAIPSIDSPVTHPATGVCSQAVHSISTTSPLRLIVCCSDKRLGSPGIHRNEHNFFEASPAKAPPFSGSIPLSEASATALPRHRKNTASIITTSILVLSRKSRQIQGRERELRRSLSLRDSFVSSRHNGLVHHQAENP
jgi:hypothetical protein